MIISASRRTDIPAFYSKWFINRVREGYCTVPNPLNMKQVSQISLNPASVDSIVFWTRNAAPLLKYLNELDSKGYFYYFLYTINNYPVTLDRNTPSLNKSIETIKSLHEKIGPERIIWRYDPIVLSSITDFSFHLNNYSKIAARLRGLSEKSIISFFDIYAKNKNKINQLASQGIKIQIEKDFSRQEIKDFLTGLSDIAVKNNIKIQNCCNPAMTQCEIEQGSCIDHEYIKKISGRTATSARDRSQRPNCRCTASRDIGMYDSCLFDCMYCYANRNYGLSKKNHEKHNPESISLLGNYHAENSDQDQLELF